MTRPPDGPVDGPPDRFDDRFGAGAPAGPVPRSPEAEARYRRRLWRRRRRIMGSLVFVAIVIALGAVVVSAVGGGDGDKNAAKTTSSTAAATTTTLPLAGPYRVTDGVNIRSGPGSSFGSLGLIEVGNTVIVVCATDGESVNGPVGPTTTWLKIAVVGPDSYVTAAYVATGADLTKPDVIAPCPPA